MTTELVLLLAIFVFVLSGAFFGPKGPIAVFNASGPRLAARVEQHITTAHHFNNASKGGATQWLPADGPQANDWQK